MGRKVGGDHQVHTGQRVQQEQTGKLGKRTVTKGQSETPRLDRIRGQQPPKGNILVRAFESVKTKMGRTARSLDTHAGKLFGALQRQPGQPLDAKSLLAEMKTLRNHFAQMEKVSGKTVDPTTTLQMALAGRLGGMDNKELLSAYSAFLSEDMTKLRSSLEKEVARNPGNVDAKRCLEDLGAIEATVVMEISGRVARGQGDKVAPLQERIAQRASTPGREELLTAQQGLRKTDKQQTEKLGDKQLEMLVGAGARAAVRRDRSGEQAEQRLQRKGYKDLSLRQVGDTMRDADLTINFNLEDFFGVKRDVKPMDDLSGMRNMFQWGARPSDNTGALKRDLAERSFFETLERTELDPDSRPLYGAMNVGRLFRGAAGEGYGASYFVLKPGVKQRCTFTVDDTFNVALLSVNKENLRKYEDELQALLPKLSEKGRAFLTANDNANLKLLVAHFAGQKGPFSGYQMDHQIAAAVPGAGPALSIDDLDKLSVLTESTFLDREATRNRVVGFDNMEDILLDLDDERLDRMMMAVESPAKGNFRIGNYIEAQIHGPVSFSEDVGALRVAIGDLEDVCRKGKLSPEEARRKLQDFCSRNGIELEIYDESDPAMTDEMDRRGTQYQRFHKEHFDPEIRKAQNQETQKALNDFLAKPLEDPEGLQTLLVGEANKLGFGEKLNEGNLNRLRQNVANAVSKLSENGLVQVDAFKVTEIARQEALKLIQTKQGLLAELDKLEDLPREHKAQFRAFALASTTLTSPEMLRNLVDSAAAGRTLLALLDTEEGRQPENLLKAMNRFAEDCGQRLNTVLANLRKEGGRDDRMLYVERSLSLGVTTCGLPKERLVELYTVLTSTALGDLRDALSISDGPHPDARQTIADALAVLAFQVGRELGRSVPQVEQDLRHTVTLTKLTQVPKEMRSDLEKAGLL